MRLVPLYVGAVWFAFAGAATAQTAYTAIVGADDTEVRAGPNDNPQLYVTNRLKRGTKVEVVEELANGWLKIHPPANSFSWISANAVQQVVPNQPNWMVIGAADARVPVIVGTDFKKDVPSQIEGSRVVRGAQVTSIGPVRVDEQGAWLPIESPPGEFRYIRAASVTKSDGTPIALATGAIGLTPGVTTVAKTDVTAGPMLTEAEMLWKQAADAERAGNIPSAIDMYTRAASLANLTHPELARQASERAAWLRSRSAVPTHSTFTPSASQPNVQLSGPVAVHTTSTPPQMPPPVATGPGRLRRAGRILEGRSTYVLESLQGQMMYYVTAEPGVNLEPFVNQKVELSGPAGYNGELRANYMRVERVQLAP